MKKYIKPIAKCIDLRSENIMQIGSITPGEGSGSHDANSKKYQFEYEDIDFDDIDY